MSRSYSRADLACKVYVGNLGESAGRRELENAFNRFGPLKNVWVARNPPGFAFVEYEDSRDAEDAVKGLDGHMLCGHRAVVEMSTGEKRTSRRGGRSGPRSASYDDKCYTCGERGHFARDCRNSGRYGGYGGGRYSNSDRRRSKRSRSRSRDRSYSPRRYSDHSRSRSRSRGRSHSRSRSRSYSQRRRHSRSSSDRD